MDLFGPSGWWICWFVSLTEEVQDIWKEGTLIENNASIRLTVGGKSLGHFLDWCPLWAMSSLGKWSWDIKVGLANNEEQANKQHSSMASTSVPTSRFLLELLTWLPLMMDFPLQVVLGCGVLSHQYRKLTRTAIQGTLSKVYYILRY